MGLLLMPHLEAMGAPVNDFQNHVVGEGEVVTPDHFRAASLGVSPQLWQDSQLLSEATGLELTQTLGILRNAGGLGPLFRMGPEDLERCGVPIEDTPKFTAFIPLASRLLCTRSAASPDMFTRRQVADELVYRGLQYSQICAGLLVWNAQGVRVTDQVIAIGSKAEAILDFQAILRAILCSDCGVSALLWIWRPMEQVVPTAQDRRNAEELRLLTSVIGVHLVDVFLLGFGDAISLGVTDQWSN